MKLFLMALLFVGALSACVTPPKAKSPEETAYLASIATEPVEFEIPKASSDDAWGRAQVFLAKHSSMKIQTATTNLVENYTPTPNGFTMEYGYRVTRVAGPKGEQFSVECFDGGDAVLAATKAATGTNAKILARYIRTGELPYPGLIAK